MGPLILPTRGPVYLDANGFIYSNDTDFRRVEDLPMVILDDLLAGERGTSTESQV